jgi:hypothetical protein
VPGQWEKYLRKKYEFKKILEWVGDQAQIVRDGLVPSKHEALSSNSSTVHPSKKTEVEKIFSKVYDVNYYWSKRI